LTVTDDSGNSDTVTVTIDVAASPDGTTAPAGISTFQPPIADFAFMPASPVAGDSVQFDGTLSADFDGTIVDYAWDFDGDGVIDSTDSVASHTFNTPGPVAVTLIVTDDSGNTDVVTVAIEIGGSNVLPQDEDPSYSTDEADLGLPVAAIQHSPLEAIAREPILFNGTSSLDPDGQIVGFAWDFDGDGEIDSTAPLVEYTFAEAGTYVVTLTAFDDEGKGGTATATIVVAPPTEGGPGTSRSFQPPVADFAYMPASPNAGDPILFNATFSTDFDGEIAGYAWDFDGDGTTDSTDAIAEYAFASPGRYPVSLTVTDDGGNTDTVTIAIDVE
jgi:PKD repeat protein